ncbi:hypothetical protein PHMEG_00017452 [Phytophthora megakarya]|uniref:CCHC-type domain-containing protein n=1 Tax=Phytophthora megakarya TaxID=4795 RepID=A0A225VYX6_9STRA|nr:hypothetical protein PHMEG_00017452 [Phytophthora megakarya]
MATFSSLPEESVDEFMFAAKLFMQGKNVDYTSPSNNGRVVVMLATNLWGGAASWYHSRVAIDQHPLEGHQYRIRAALRKCKQIGTIDVYVAQFRRLIAHVRELSQLDQLDHFCAETSKGVCYLRCKTRSKVISHAQAFERAHFSLSLPMGISSVTLRDVFKEMCRQHRLCFYCKGSGHRIRDCPKKPQGNVQAQQM